jgi:hypothetical protein
LLSNLVTFREKAGESIASQLAGVEVNGDDEGTSKSKFSAFAALQDEGNGVDEDEEQDFGGLMVSRNCSHALVSNVVAIVRHQSDHHKTEKR